MGNLCCNSKGVNEVSEQRFTPSNSNATIGISDIEIVAVTNKVLLNDLIKMVKQKASSLEEHCLTIKDDDVISRLGPQPEDTINKD